MLWVVAGEHCGVKVIVRLVWGMGGVVCLQTVGPKSVHAGNSRPLIALRCLLLMLVSTPLRIEPLLFWFPCIGLSGGIYIHLYSPNTW